MNVQKLTKDQIDDLVFAVYCARVDADSGKGASARMIELDGDQGAKLRRRADFYRPTVLEVLTQLDLYERPSPPKKQPRDGAVR